LAFAHSNKSKKFHFPVTFYWYIFSHEFMSNFFNGFSINFCLFKQGEQDKEAVTCLYNLHVPFLPSGKMQGFGISVPDPDPNPDPDPPDPHVFGPS
jgi:hypothetical protein